MPVEDVKDYLGHSMQLYRHEKKPQYLSSPVFNPRMCEDMPTVPLRADDILLCSYPKSGCHWVWEITRMLMQGRSQVDDVNKEHYMMEFSGALHYGDIEELPSPRLLNNHQFFENQPGDLLDKDVKVIFVYRNPKDVAVSYYYHHLRLGYGYTGPDFGAYLSRFSDGLVDANCMFDYLKDWERAIQTTPGLRVCVLCYEDLQHNPLREVRRLSQFLGKQQTDEFLTEVLQAAAIDNMREAKSSSMMDEQGSVMYRKGKVGDWKNHFSVAQSEWFDHVTRVRMAGSRLFKFRYDL